MAERIENSQNAPLFKYVVSVKMFIGYLYFLLRLIHAVDGALIVIPGGIVWFHIHFEMFFGDMNGEHDYFCIQIFK